MRFAHLSDFHLGQSPSKTIVPDAADVIARIAEKLNEISDALDFVVISGDITEDADKLSFRAFERSFATVDLPIYTVPGNHDGPEGYHLYRQCATPLSDWDITNQVVNLGALRLLGIDTCIQTETTGRIGAEALELVKSEVAKQQDTPLVIVMHHPPLLPGMAEFDVVARLERAEDLLGILAKSNDSVVVLSGHIHRPYQALQSKIACYVAGSPTSAFTSNLPFGDSPIRPVGLQGFFFVHDMRRDGAHVVTPQHFTTSARSLARGS